MSSEPGNSDELLLPFSMLGYCCSGSESSSPPTQVADDLFASSRMPCTRSPSSACVAIVSRQERVEGKGEGKGKGKRRERSHVRP
jgi:hypothetical protein